jgi:glycerol dehydrogenase-like iron-containing ADH family enzyme
MNGLPAIAYVDLKEYSDTRRSVLLTNTLAEKVAKPFLKNLRAENVLYIDESSEAGVSKLLKEIDGQEVVYAVGGGTVLDVAKLVSHRSGLPFVCIPTIISTDALFDDYAVIRKDGFISFVKGQLAEKIVIDSGLIRKSPHQLTYAGCGDVLSIYTGLFDWKTANTLGKQQENEAFSPAVYATAQGILDYLLENAQSIKSLSPKGISILVDCLAMETMLCNSYGTLPAIPEVGGEHFFTKCIENKMPHFLHGEMVGLAVIVTAHIQGQNTAKIISFMDEVGLNYRPDGISRALVLETLKEMPKYVAQHKLRWTVYTDFDFPGNRDSIDTLLDDISIA